ncbi:hypothetical protein HPP92_016985 [Vanilla planifolia]|uniref:Serine-threonine/tyrosine-protein kinase catalytic domain-containing protein n=1 Tax=Vanilla planifolia TaxID=51239 RepID=A0A835QBW3_VANPL|nr:hypothetical protein HPP92_016985 [Vanilla planifolia]
MFGKASESCDVYSFGILLLELASGRKPIEKLSPTVKRSITEWALPLVQEKRFKEIADPNLNGNFVEAELERMVLVALVCSHGTPDKRPTMHEVVDLLKGKAYEKLASLENDDIFKPDLIRNNREFAAIDGSSNGICVQGDAKGDMKQEAVVNLTG